MTINLALEYIPRRMRELGYGDNYILRFHVFQVLDGDSIKIQSFGGEFYLLVNDYNEITIESDTGFYETLYKKANILQYEHSGEITISNTSINVQGIRMIQVIPKHLPIKCETKNCQ